MLHPRLQTAECALEELLQAAENGRFEVVKSLVDDRVVGINSTHWTRRRLQPRIAEVWQDYSVQAECSALLCASSAGHADVLRLLSSRGATADARTRQGMSALMLASFAAHSDVVEVLLRKMSASSVDYVSEYGFTALHLACASPHEDHSKSAAVVEALLHARCNPHTMDGKRRTPLHYAAARHNKEACAHLIAARAWLQEKDEDCNTPMDLALGRAERISNGMGIAPPSVLLVLRELRWLPSVRLLWIGHLRGFSSASSSDACPLSSLSRDLVLLICKAVIRTHIPN
ncbi:hypothetical protein AB1Y20_005145 [Prymnesium parvum]|uniref:Ankyrin repeat protein n=1 Tax=Prymnesium parvum TaxID=97485 RepID=A0AB34J3S7_PRYPA